LGGQKVDKVSDIQWGRSPEEDDGIVLEAMLFAEERGSYSVLKSFMDDFGDRLLKASDAKISAAYRDLETRAGKAFEHEAEHGRRSLMKWDHPVNIKWVKLGLIKLSPEERQAFEACNGTSVTA
jgi:hypothetical protein